MASDGIEVDVQRRTAWVGAGVKGGELLAELDGTGLTFLAGSNPDPTVVGMTITGGISWFSRAYGLGADSIVTVELVDGLGRLRRVSATEDPELFWAVRGGGGDFGIITRMEVALHPAPEVYGGRMLWPIEQMGDVLRTFKAVTEEAPDELTIWYHTYQFPPLPEIPEPIRGKGVRLDRRRLPRRPRGRRGAAGAVPRAARAGDGPDGRGAAGRARARSPTSRPTRCRACSAPRLLTHLDEDTIDALVAVVGADSGSPLPIVQIRHLGGAFADDRGRRAAPTVRSPSPTTCSRSASPPYPSWSR